MIARRTTRKIITRAIIFLILGASVNVAVAWGRTGIVTWPQMLALDEASSITEWPFHVPAHWPAMRRALRQNVLGWTHTRYTASNNELNDQRVVQTEAYIIDVHMVGWPLRTLIAERRAEFIITGKPATSTNRFDGHPAPSAWREGLSVSAGYGFIPLRPIWPNFAINTIFYGAILWLVFAAPFAIRKHRRIKRSLCPVCAYPFGTSEVCTECGAQVASSSNPTPGGAGG